MSSCNHCPALHKVPQAAPGGSVLSQAVGTLSPVHTTKEMLKFLPTYFHMVASSFLLMLDFIVFNYKFLLAKTEFWDGGIRSCKALAVQACGPEFRSQATVVLACNPSTDDPWGLLSQRAPG